MARTFDLQAEQAGLRRIRLHAPIMAVLGHSQIAATMNVKAGEAGAE